MRPVVVHVSPGHGSPDLADRLSTWADGQSWVEHAVVRPAPDGGTDAVLYVQDSEASSEGDLTSWVQDRVRTVILQG